MNVHLRLKIGKVFGFNIVDAAEEMAGALVELNELYVASFAEVNQKIRNLSPRAIQKVNEVISSSINSTHTMLLPAINVRTIIHSNPIHNHVIKIYEKIFILR